MLVYRLDLQPHHLQEIHTALEDRVGEFEDRNMIKESIQTKQTLEQVEEQLGRQGVKFVR